MDKRWDTPPSCRDQTSDSCGGMGSFLMRFFCASLCALALVAFLPLTVRAVEGGNLSGIIEESYDRYAHGFVTEYQEGYTVISDLPNGMLATSDVCAYCLDGRISAVYRNGEPFTPELVDERSYFRQSGAYTLMISDVTDTSLPTRVFSFRIVDKESLDLHAISIPACVTVLELQHDGVSLDVEASLSNAVLDLRTEGAYQIIWQSGSSDQMSLSFRVYNRRPLFAINEAAYSATLTFSNGLDHIRVYRNGKPAYAASGGAWNEKKEEWILSREFAADDNTQAAEESSFVLSKPGDYTVLAYAENGDARMDTVSVAKKRDVLGFFAVLILALVAVFLTMFLTAEKKKQSVVR